MNKKSYKERVLERKRAKRKKRILRILSVIILLSIFVGSNSGVKDYISQSLGGKSEQLIEEAEYLAATYDYDEAIRVLESVRGIGKKTKVQALIEEYKAQKAECVPININEVTHIFYHSLVVDPQRAFANQNSDPQAVGNNQWMTTIEEFKKITQEMYERGYVLVSIHDLMEPESVLLPPNKKPFVLSIDDLSYYHTYDGYGYASKLIVNEKGEVVNEYINAEGEIEIGLYDVVPLLDQFVKEHPDASYHGAKGIIALTGYNGILGYRTDETYDLSNVNCDADQRAWIEQNPDFDLETERKEAKKVADAMKASGWEFASHTWGHLKVGSLNLAGLEADTQKWKENVEPLVGECDTIIFAHGQDLQSVDGAYTESNEKYQYLREQGYRIFCNVDSAQYKTYLGEDYMRQGRRNLDGYRIYNNAIGEQDNVSDLFDATEILDPLRPKVMPL